MRRLHVILTLFFVIVAGASGLVAIHIIEKNIQNYRVVQQKMKNLSEPQYKTIGVVSYARSSCTIAASEGFMESLGTDNYRFKVVCANDDKILLRSIIEDLVDSGVDLIFSIGTTSSQLAKEITLKRNRLIPIVFTAVKDPVRINLMDSEQSSGCHLTGVTGIALSWNECISMLYYLKHTINKAVIACDFNPGSMLEKDVNDIKELLESRNTKVCIVPVYGMIDVMQRVLPFLTEDVDVFFCLRDDTVINCMDKLVKVCNSAKITIYSTYLEGVKKGAAIGIGTYEKMYGIKAAVMAKQILEKGINPSHIPLVKIESDGYKLLINSKTAKSQGLIIDPNLRFFIKSAEII